MYQPLIRLHKSFPAVVTACLLSLPLLQAGCEGDVDAADKQVRQQLSEGAQKSDAAVTSAPTVPAAYKQAAGVTKASPAVRVEALLRLAEAERDRALALMAEADQLDTDFYRLVGAVNRQAARVKSNNTMIAGLTQLNPTQAQQAIQQQQSAAQGNEKPVWIEHETGPISAGKALEQQAGQLQEQIGQLEKQSKDLATQRAKMVADAEQLERQSNEAQGQQSAELFGQSVDSRKQAADLSVQIEALEAKMMPLRQDLERTQAQQQAVAKTVQTFGGQLQATQQAWQKVQEQIAALQNLNKQILSGGGNEPANAPASAPAQDPAAAVAAAPVPASISGKLRQINDVYGQIEARRSEAEQLLKSAVGDAKKAGDAGATLVRELGSRINGSATSQRPEAATWKRMVELHNPSRFKLTQASLDIFLAGLYRNRAADLVARSAMATGLNDALKPAGLDVPQEAATQNLQADLDASKQLSTATYGEAEQLLKDVIEAPRSNDVLGNAAKAAHLLQLVRLYSQAQLDPQAAAGLLASAKQLAAQGDQVQLPADALPVFIQEALELKAPPTTGPATRPGAAAPAGTPTGSPAPSSPAPSSPAPSAPAPGATGEQPTPAPAPAPAPSPAPAGTGQ